MDVVSFFAGCGGLDLGFEQAGFRVVWANEFEPHCCATYVRYHPNTEFVLYNFPCPTCTEPITLQQAIGDITEEPNRFPGGKMENSVDEASKSRRHPNCPITMFSETE